MKVSEADIPDIKIIEPDVFGDARGFFMEIFNSRRYGESGIPGPFVQDNLSRSTKGVLRGLHFQSPNGQGKLVWVNRGAVFDVAVDIRVGSPTFGRAFSIELNDCNHFQIYIPAGFAHGFYALSDEVDFVYKCTDYYHAESEMGVAWNDPDIGIHWPDEQPTLSDKDRVYPRLKNIARESLPQYAP